MEDLFSNYYQFSRVSKNDPVNKYQLVRKLKDYKGFSQLIKKVSVFRPILYQPDHVVAYKQQNKGEDLLTLLIPWNKENRIGIARHSNHVILFNTTPDYENVEIFIIEKRWITEKDLFTLIQNGKLKREMQKIRERVLVAEA